MCGAAEPEDRAQHHRNRHAEADAHPADVPRLLTLPRAYGLAGQHRGRIAERQRHHECQCRQVGRDLVRTRHHRTEARDEQRHEGERGHIRDERQADRDAQPQELPVSPCDPARQNVLRSWNCV